MALKLNTILSPAACHRIDSADESRLSMPQALFRTLNPAKRQDLRPLGKLRVA